MIGLYEITPNQWQNIFPNAFYGSTDPSLDAGNHVTTGKVWVQTTSDTEPYGAVLGVWFYDSDGTWQALFSGSTTGNPDGSDSLTYLVRGGAIAWVSGLTYQVGPTDVVIAGEPVHCAGGTITLDVADPTDPRRDVIVIDNTGALTKLTGTPAPTPVSPTPDPSLYFQLEEVQVGAGATTPTDVTVMLVYSEDAGSGGGEFDSAVSGGTIVTNNLTSPLDGTKDVKGTACDTNHYVEFLAPTPQSIDVWDKLVFLFKPTAAWNNKRTLTCRLYSGTTQRGGAVVMKTGVYGLDLKDTSAAKLVSIPISAFSVPTGLTFDKIRFVITGSSGTVGFQADTFSLQSGVSGPAGGSGLPAGGAINDALFKRSGTDFDTEFRAIQQSDVTGLVAALAAKAAAADLTTESTTRAADDAALDGRLDALEGSDLEKAGFGAQFGAGNTTNPLTVSDESSEVSLRAVAAGTINRIMFDADAVCTAAVDIKKNGTSIFTGTAVKPTLTGATAEDKTDMTDITVAVAAGDLFTFVLDDLSAGTPSRLTVTGFVTK